MFFVEKDQGRKQRLIIDARPANAHFKEPPGVARMTSEGLARLEVQLPDAVDTPGEEGQRILEEFTLFIGLSGVSNCFHRMRVQPWLARYFCLPPVPAYVARLAGCEVPRHPTATSGRAAKCMDHKRRP